VEVDVRGSGASYGTSRHPWPRAEIADGRAIVDWITAQSWSDGGVGAYGNSYSAGVAELLTAAQHPALRAVIARFDHFDNYAGIGFPGGIFNELFMRNWAETTRALDNDTMPPIAGLLGRLAVRGVKPVDADSDGSMLAAAVRDHATNGDPYAALVGLLGRDDAPTNGVSPDTYSVHAFRADTEKAGTPIFGWGSWLDADTADTVLLRYVNDRNSQRAVIGPWSHGGELHSSPYVEAGTPTDPDLTAQAVEALRFFDERLADGHGAEAAPKTLTYYTLGEERWKTTTVWPPPGQVRRRWYLSEGHTLATTPPATVTGSDVYTVRFDATTGLDNRWHTELHSRRVTYPDRVEQDRLLLTYTSPPLVEDLEITGHPIVEIHLTSTASDGAFYVYLEDVNATGAVRYVTDGQLRALHRKVSDDPPPYRQFVPYHSFKRRDAMPLRAGEIATLRFGLLPTSVVIRQGHRIRIAIAGHDRGNFARIPETGRPTVTVMRNAFHASFIDLPVIPR